MSKRLTLIAYVLPFALFMVALVVAEGFRALGVTHFGDLTLDPMYWVYPVQTVVCAAVLLWYWRAYDFGRTNLFNVLMGVGAGLIIFGLWIAPQEFFHQPRRTEGFDPHVIPMVYYWMLAARLTRLVLVVPLVEEIFWRGFLLRYLVKDDFSAIPFGNCSKFSFWAVAVGFTAEHAITDWPAAIFTGILLNLVAMQTRSLAACVIAHAVANLALGLYICTTRQWGFW